MSNSRQELEPQHKIATGLKAIAEQSNKLMTQLHRPAGNENLYNMLGQDIKRAEKKINHLSQQENDIDAFRKNNRSLVETNKLLAEAHKKSAAQALLTKDVKPSERSQFMSKEIALVAKTISALEKKRDLLSEIDKSQRHRLTQQGINPRSLRNEQKRLRDEKINAGASIVTMQEQRQTIAQKRHRSAQADNQARRDKLEKLRNTSSANFSIAKSAAIGGANLLAPGLEFEKQLSQLQAQLNLGKSAPQLTALEQQARGMSQSGYTPDQAIQAQAALAKQGLNAKEIITASPAALTLSAATGSSVNDTAATMAEMQRSFNLAPDQFDRIADVLALASNQYGMDVQAVGAALKSKAATGAELFSAAQQIAPPGREKLQANQVTGAAQHLVNIKGDNLDGDIQKLFASWDSLRINLFTGQSAALRELTQTATGWLVQLNTWISNNPALASTLLQVAGGLTLLLGGLSGVGLIATQVLSGFSIISGAILNAGKTMIWLGRIAMTNPLLAVVSLIALAAFTMIENWDKIGPFFSNLWEMLATGWERTKDYISNSIKELIGKFVSWTKSLTSWMPFGDDSGDADNAENDSSWFAGAFDRGGDIPAGQFGIVGENGPELVSGPVQVTGRRHTAAMSAALLSLSSPVMATSPVTGSPAPQIQVPSVTINITASAGQNEQDIGREVARQFELLAHRQAANARGRMG